MVVAGQTVLFKVEILALRHQHWVLLIVWLALTVLVVLHLSKLTLSSNLFHFLHRDVLLRMNRIWLFIHLTLWLCVLLLHLALLFVWCRRVIWMMSYCLEVWILALNLNWMLSGTKRVYLLNRLKLRRSHLICRSSVIVIVVDPSKVIVSILCFRGALLLIDVQCTLIMKWQLLTCSAWSWIFENVFLLLAANRIVTTPQLIGVLHHQFLLVLICSTRWSASIAWIGINIL